MASISGSTSARMTDDQKAREFWLGGPESLSRFLEGMAAAQERLNRGYESQSALECIVLSAAIVDGLLRMGLIMKRQLNYHSSEIDESLLRQGDGDKKITERWVIDEAETLRVIPGDMARLLRSLYETRNKCIHRYIISEVNYAFATRLVFDYATAIEQVRLEIKKLEEQQHAQGIGVVVAEADTTEPGYDVEMKKWIAEMSGNKESRS